MEALEVLSPSRGYTQRLGTRLGEEAQPGDLYLLIGGLGAGKTTFIQGIAWGLGIQGYVTSASFVLVGEHPGRFPLYHIDLYRIEQLNEAAHLGLDDYLYGRGVCAVEWADRALPLFPQERLEVHLKYMGPRRRQLQFLAQGHRYRELLAKLAKWVEAQA